MEYGYSQYRISDVQRKRVVACAQFLYKGYEISFSQIFDTPTKVAIFDCEGNGRFVCEFDTVEACIEWINANG